MSIINTSKSFVKEHIYQDSVLVKMFRTDSFIVLRTVSHQHGKSPRFYFVADTLSSMVSEDLPLPVIENDMLNFCMVCRSGKEVSFRMHWLQSGVQDELHGYQQLFSLPIEKVEKALAGEDVNHLSYKSPYQRVFLTFSNNAHEAISDIVQDKLKQHALCRFFRDNLSYGRRENISICRDSWVGGFYFCSGSGFDGGIVPHESMVTGRDGRKHRRVTYSIHT